MALVGEAILSASVQVLFDKIGSSEFVDLFRRKKLDESLVKKLEITLLSLNAVLNDAEEKQFLNSYVKKWLDELQDAVFDADDLLDEINAEVLRCKVEAESQTVTNKVWNFLPTYLNQNYQGMNGRIHKLLERLEHLAKQKDFLGLREGVVGMKISQRTPTTSLVDESCVYGRDGDKEKLMKLLLSDDASNKDVSVVTIVGMGGVGKTTLAQLLYNDDKVKEHFNLRTWAYVSEAFDVTRVTKTLLESVSSEAYDNKDLSFLQVELGQQIKGKKFLFVLDDLWNEKYQDLSLLQRPFASGARGSWVIVTTRNESVAGRMHPVPIHFLEQLSDEDCWLLLSKHAFENGNLSAHPHLQEVGKKIALKCNGLPLAAETLGGLLRFNTNYEEWNNILNSNVWELPPEICNTIPALRLSYHYLPTHLKRCFAYCSIFPKGYEFQKEDIVLLWVAESLIPQAESEKRMEELTKKYFDDLLSRSFFQRSRNEKFTMHDLINDLAMSVSRESCLRWKGGESHEVLKRVRHLSYARGQVDCAAKFEPLYEVKHLRTFLPLRRWIQHYVSKKVLHELMPSLLCLRVLKLSKYDNIVELPNSIGNLIHLRYLDLSNTGIKRLPATVCTLYSLQTLLLAGCRSLFELPTYMRKLINLRHLDCSGTQIKEMPVQMGRLKSLRTLTTFCVGKSNGSTIGELRELSHLEGKLSILKLNNVVDGRDALQANLKNKKDLKELELAWDSEDADHSEKVRDVLDKLQPCMNLEKLTVKLYGGTSFPNWLGDSTFNKMKVMRLEGCHYCFELPPLGQLPALKELFICKMKFLRTLGPELYGQPFQPFQSLERLEFKEMAEWEEWVPSGSRDPDFPHLQELILGMCPKLRGSLPCDLPCLKKLSVEGCGVLHDQRVWSFTSTSTNLNYNSLQELKIVDGCQTGLLSLLETKLLSRLRIINFNDIQCLPNINRLQSLTLLNCPTLSSFPEDGLPTSLTSLNIFSCRRLEFLPHEMLAKLTSLDYLSINDSCDSMRSFPLGIFPKLTTLIIGNCENLESLSLGLIEEEGAVENPSHLNQLNIFGCPNLVCFPQGGLPTPNLTELDFDSCEKLKSLPERIHTLTALGYLDIRNLPNLESIAEDGGLPPNLRDFNIYNCERLRASSSSVGDYRNWGLQALVSLERFEIVGRGSDEILETLLKQQLLPTTLHALWIEGIPTLKSLDGKGLAHLTVLRSLFIYSCKSLEFLPGEALQHLTSLQELYISDCPSLQFLPEEALQHLTSLQELYIYDCPSLQFLPEEALQHLTSLQTLAIGGCDSIQFLPEEGLPPSLSYLCISNCSTLKKRYENKTGQDWAKISHIPCITIDEEVII
ncbi:putative disease resistance RPP13-like protein 1 [Prunus avium]|uniref:Disease resistance RPP13-like protein 1 n=1 Tax=Prunus avium TaxID=42229 RepID=A0A6P5SGU9_PRUAV|nr:putative disease resistance RPP13-like protein 1 [Prunus avium]XP_021812981.1 putative disease resistance RPP13-like protein 1 [Prunus avium]XP_021812982.1 putative disease resistance RPP13-like protein 1 [Prunus avium]XP_021812983.1 putative disease resistance RPP13-like protein 1 [Prunus avium]XP_021812984.1 putative disease resistance RPP13-like protein 1 [Prunus avium]XP_021812985.1 putative disease resistance RPP13-like protein 1 [Prunus avium]XP_021812986.1 putative disease resistanc